VGLEFAILASALLYELLSVQEACFEIVRVLSYIMFCNVSDSQSKGTWLESLPASHAVGAKRKNYRPDHNV